MIASISTATAAQSPDVAARFLEGDQPRLDARLVDKLVRAEHQGNTRDLTTALWAAIAHSPGDVIEDDGAPMPTVASDQQRAQEPAKNPEPSTAKIREALEQSVGNVDRASKLLGFSSRYALYRHARKLGLTLRDRR